MRRFLRTGRARISRTSQKVQSYLFIFFPSVDERLFSTIRPEMASPSSPKNEYQVMAKSLIRQEDQVQTTCHCHQVMGQRQACHLHAAQRLLSIKPAETGKGKNPIKKIMGKPCFAAGFPLISWIGVPLDRRIVERTETL